MPLRLRGQRALLVAGDVAGVEDPGDPSVRDFLIGLGADALGIPVDDEGMSVETLLESGAGPRMVHITPKDFVLRPASPLHCKRTPTHGVMLGHTSATSGQLKTGIRLLEETVAEHGNKSGKRRSAAE